MRKVLMLATTAAMIEQFNKNNIRILQDMGYEVHVAGNFREGNPISDEKLSQFQEWITAGGGTWFHIPATRKPLDFKNNIAAYRAILQLIRENRYDFIHCHTPVGSVLGRVAAHQTGTKIIYTAHGFHFFQGAPLKNWLLYYPIERFLSRWTDVLICINHEDYDRARRTFHAKRTEYVPGVGVDTEAFRSTNEADAALKRKELGIGAEDIVLLSVGELIARKNHEVVIRALSKIQDQNYKYLIVGKGNQKEHLSEIIRNQKQTERISLLGYRTDVSALCQIADVFLLPSYQEGLSVALMEAMAAGLACVVSDIRGNVELIEDGKGGYLCNPNDANTFADKIMKLSHSQELRNEMGKFNIEKIKEFDEKIINKRMEEIYSDIEMRNGGKRILHFLKTGNYSGAEKVVITIISEMKNRYGYEGIYVSLSGNIDDVLEKNGIEHAVVKANTVKEYQRVINRYNPDVIHAHDFGTSVIVSNTKNHAVMISHLHCNPPWIKKICLRTLMYAYAARKFQKVLVVSQSVLDEYVWKKSFLAKAVVVGNPVDRKRVICLAEKEAENIEKSDVVFLGRFSSAKNPVAFINIINECKSKNRKIHALMIGQGELYGACRDKIVQLGLEQNVKQLGFKENPYGYLKNTKVLCAPSAWEGFGLVVVEAFALGIPVVATPVGGMKHLVTEEAGFLSTDEKQLSEEIMRLLTNDAYYKKKSEGALKRAQQLDNIDEYIKTIYELYKGTS